MRIGFLSTLDARNPRSWSGTPYYMAQALAKTVGEVIYLGPVNPPLLTVMKGWDRVRRTFALQSTLPKQCMHVARANAKIIGARIKKSRPDLIVAPAGSALIGELCTDLPIVYISDTTFRLMQEYNPEFTNVTDRAIAEADALEAAAIARADILIYPTEWAAHSARVDYGAAPEKVFVQPFGANLERIPDLPRQRRIGRADGLKLIFVGVNWRVKGGPIALSAIRALRRKGIAADLTVVGCEPPADVPRDHLTVIPFLDKNDPAQLQKLSELYHASDFLILPTRTECFGIVFCEAAAHGVPSIATATGGVPDVIRDGVTGYTLPYEAKGEDYARIISEIALQPKRLEELRKSAREDFEQRLNWTVWAERTGYLCRTNLPTTRNVTK